MESFTVLITGCSRGIGLALAGSFARAGHRVIATARRPDQSEALTALGRQHPETVSVYPLDVTSSESVAALEARLDESARPLDILINNAGIFPGEAGDSIEEVGIDAFRDAFETNCLGAVRVSLACLPSLRAGSGGKLVQISSGAASLTHPISSPCYAYGTSKAALNRFTLSLANEIPASEVIITALSPGWVQTEMGGTGAEIDVDTSARSLTRTILGLQPRHHGQFLGREGEPYSW